MIQSGKAIVLHHIKYSESSVIAYMYTEKNGRIAFLIPGIKGKKSSIRSALLQPLTLINLEYYYKAKKELQRIKELKVDLPFSSIPFDFVKGTVSLFIAEFLYKVLKEEESNPGLFNFLHQSVHYFDLMEGKTEDFHILFLSHLTKYLGFFPHNNYSENRKYFDLMKGEFVFSEPIHSHFMPKTIAHLFSQALKTSFSDRDLIKMNGAMRNDLLTKLLEFYQIHLDKKLEIKSVSIFKDLFHS